MSSDSLLSTWTRWSSNAAQSLYVENGYTDVDRAQSGRFDIILYEKRLPTC